MSNNSGSDIYWQGETQLLTFGCPSTPVTTVMVGEGVGWLSQNSVYKKFSSPTCCTEGDPELCTSIGDGSRGIWSHTGARAQSVGVQNLSSEKLTRIGAGHSCPSVITPVGAQDIPPSGAPLSDKRHTGSSSGGSLLVCSVFLALKGTLRWWVSENSQELCFSH